MQLVLTEDQELLAKTAADFAAENSPVARLRALRDANDPDGFSRALWKQMAELGWVGIPFPESLGGAGMGLAELAVVLEELGRNLAPEPFLSTVLLAGQVLQIAGSDAQKNRWLEPVVRGDAFLALAQQERGSRFDLHRVATRAEARGSGFRLIGEKIAVLDGAVADALVVVARTAGSEDDRHGISLFLVPSSAAGLRAERQRRVDSRGAALVHLEGCEVGADALIGKRDEGLSPLEAAVDRATVGLCAEMLGSMSEAFARTLDYLKHRIQFGVPIGSFQALKHRAAQEFIQIELCRSAVMAAARAVDAGRVDAASLVSLAKARCSDAAILVANEAIQMHGGIGMTDEHEIGFYLKRARVAELTLGDSAWHRARWARLAGY
ncbi:MAG TPA: acyl-CoA dehydrogenase [Myxococcota bacterium]|nr:acyl-CoA dehydrogenase [Myxococcota bacterium]